MCVIGECEREGEECERTCTAVRVGRKKGEREEEREGGIAAVVLQKVRQALLKSKLGKLEN